MNANTFRCNKITLTKRQHAQPLRCLTMNERLVSILKIISVTFLFIVGFGEQIYTRLNGSTTHLNSDNLQITGFSRIHFNVKANTSILTTERF